ncbi:unnamed protein product, partial [Ectocarpus sp. 8 AP-2014]
MPLLQAGVAWRTLLSCTGGRSHSAPPQKAGEACLPRALKRNGNGLLPLPRQRAPCRRGYGSAAENTEEALPLPGVSLLFDTWTGKNNKRGGKDPGLFAQEKEKRRGGGGGGASSALLCGLLGGALLGGGGGPAVSGAWAAAGGGAAVCGRSHAAMRCRSNTIALVQLGSAAMGGGFCGWGDAGARRACVGEAAARRPTEKKLGGYTISGRDRGRRSWEDWERGHRSFATATGVQNKEASIVACGGGGQHEVERETSSRIQPPSLPLSASSAGGRSSSERRLLPENSCGGELVAGEEEEVGGAVLPVVVAAVAAVAADPADPFHGDLPLAREQRLKMAVAETGSATVEAAASTASLNGHNRGGGGGGASAAGRPPPPSAFAGGGSPAAGTDDRTRRGGGVSSSSNGLQGGDRKNDDSARMRRYLPGTKATGQQHSLGAARGEGAPQPRSSPGRKDKDPPVEGKNGGKDMASEAEARAEEPALLSSRREGAVNKTSIGGGGGGGEQQHPDDDKAAVEDASTRQQRHQRKCPPAVGFVGGFRDVPVGAPSSGRRKSTTEALIHALSEPLKPSPRHAAGAEASVGLGGGEFPKTSGRWPTTTKASNGKGAAAVQQDRSGGGSRGAGRPRPNARDAFSRVALDERSKEMSPPNRNVTITFDPGASTLLGCITANTDVYGPALCSDTAATLTREETAAYLERWVLIAVKHGVLPRELRALLQDEGHDQRGGTPGYYSVREEGRETAAATGTVGEDGGGPYRVGGRSGTGGTGSSSPHGLGGDGVTSVSWTKYGWNRFDVAAPSASVAGDVQTPQPRTRQRRRRRRQLALDDEEVEEEEEMENIAEALVGGGGEVNGAAHPGASTTRDPSPDAPLSTSSAAALRTEWRYRHPDPVAGTAGGSSSPSSERRGAGGDSANSEEQQQASLG